MTVRHGPVAHGSFVACALLIPAVQAVLGVERHPVDRRVRHFQVPAFCIRRRRHAETHPHHLASGDRVNRIRLGVCPRDGRRACDLLGRKLSCGVDPIVAPVAQSDRLGAGVQIQYRAGLCESGDTGEATQQGERADNSGQASAPAGVALKPNGWVFETQRPGEQKSGQKACLGEGRTSCLSSLLGRDLPLGVGAVAGAIVTNVAALLHVSAISSGGCMAFW